MIASTEYEPGKCDAIEFIYYYSFDSFMYSCLALHCQFQAHQKLLDIMLMASTYKTIK